MKDTELRKKVNEFPSVGMPPLLVDYWRLTRTLARIFRGEDAKMYWKAILELNREFPEFAWDNAMEKGGQMLAELSIQATNVLKPPDNRGFVTLVGLAALVDLQAEDDGLWFDAKTAPEGYLQQALRRLHDAIEEYVNQSRIDTSACMPLFDIGRLGDQHFLLQHNPATTCTGCQYVGKELVRGVQELEALIHAMYYQDRCQHPYGERTCSQRAEHPGAHK